MPLGRCCRCEGWAAGDLGDLAQLLGLGWRGEDGVEGGEGPGLGEEVLDGGGGGHAVDGLQGLLYGEALEPPSAAATSSSMASGGSERLTDSSA